MSQDDLIRLLSEAGEVVDAFRPSDRFTGRPRGFAFVTFARDTEAADAIRLFHEREVDGQPLAVSVAEDRDGSPGGDRASSGASSRPARSFKRKGSRRGLRGRKRSL